MVGSRERIGGLGVLIVDEQEPAAGVDCAAWQEGREPAEGWGGAREVQGGAGGAPEAARAAGGREPAAEETGGGGAELRWSWR